MKDKKIFIRAFGKNEYGFADFPVKISNVQVARIEHGNDRGCTYCFPHGWETSNASVAKNRRSWKFYRRNQFK